MMQRAVKPYARAVLTLIVAVLSALVLIALHVPLVRSC